MGSRDAGVMGVVKYFKPPVKSRGKDCYTVLYIIDNSTTDSSGLTCIIFNPVREMLPVVCTCGEVVLIKGLSINNFDGARQAKGHEHTLVGVFPLDIKCPPPDMIGNFYAMKTHEKARLQDLQSWAATRSVPMLINSKIEELSLSSYCSCVCLVLAVSQVLELCWTMDSLLSSIKKLLHRAFNHKKYCINFTKAINSNRKFTLMK